MEGEARAGLLAGNENPEGMRECRERMGASQEVLGVKNTAASAGDIRDLGSIPGLGTSPGRREAQLTSVFLPGEIHGQRSRVGYSPWGHKESGTTEQLSTHAERGWVALIGLHPASEPWGPPDRLPISRGSTTHPDRLLKLGYAGQPASQPLAQPINTPAIPTTLSTQNLFLVFSPHGHQPLSCR